MWVWQVNTNNQGLTVVKLCEETLASYKTVKLHLYNFTLTWLFPNDDGMCKLRVNLAGSRRNFSLMPRLKKKPKISPNLVYPLYAQRASSSWVILTGQQSLSQCNILSGHCCIPVNTTNMSRFCSLLRANTLWELFSLQKSTVTHFYNLRKKLRAISHITMALSTMV